MRPTYRTNDRVVFFFSVNESGHWQDMAIMTSPIRPAMLAADPAMAPHWSAESSVEWVRLVNMPFSASRSLRNPLNGNWPVSRSRDCQELAPELGKLMVCLVYTAPGVSLGPQQSSLSTTTTASGGGSADPLDHHSLLDMPYGVFGSPAGVGGGSQTGSKTGSPSSTRARSSSGGSPSGSPSMLCSMSSSSSSRFPLVAGPGFMFGCNQNTVEECMSRSLFGLPLHMDDTIRQIVHPGTSLFWYNINDNGPSDRRRRGSALEPNENYKTSLCQHWLDNNGLCSFVDGGMYAHAEHDLRKEPDRK